MCDTFSPAEPRWATMFEPLAQMAWSIAKAMASVTRLPCETAMRSGANDFIIKDRLHRLAPAVERELNASLMRAEQRKIAAALEESQRQLQESRQLEAVGRLAGGVAHDFNNLVAAILSYADLILHSLPPGDQQPEFLLERPELESLSGATLGSILGSGVVSLALAYLGYFALIDRAGASFAALYAFLVPPLSLLLGVVLQGQTLTSAHLGGLALVLAGLWMILRRGEKLSPPAMRNEAVL